VKSGKETDPLACNQPVILTLEQNENTFELLADEQQFAK